MKIHFIYKRKIYFEQLDKTFVVPQGNIEEIKTVGVYDNDLYSKSEDKYKLEFVKVHRDKKVVSCKFKRRKRYIKEINFKTYHNVVRLIKD